MKKLYIKYSFLFLLLIMVMIYFFFIDTPYKKENLLPFFLLSVISSTGLYFSFKYEKKFKKK
ncbi:MAG TPA: hypothetical protein PKD67_11310 [Ignavibacteriaceae bacterium]|nr:hypothetical protein [Ignavibacteriaceae bacterium]